MSDPNSDSNGSSEGSAPDAADAASAAADEEQDEAAASEPVDPLAEVQAEAKKLRDQLLRTAADFDNFRKRSRRENIEADRHGREELLRELLPVFDNLERAVAHAETASDVQSLSEGIRMVMRQFGDTLNKLGIERVVSEGKSFDPSLHEAIQQMESDEHPPGTITAEVQAGYRMGDRLVRPAMVVVAKGPVQPAEADSGADGGPTEGEGEAVGDDS